MDNRLGTYMITCPFCHHQVAIGVQSEEIDKIITVTCKTRPKTVWGVGCGKSFRSHCYVKVRIGVDEIEPFTVVGDNPPSSGKKED